MEIMQMLSWTQDMWSAIIGLFGFIPNWGWMIIVFTICLKIVLSPLDYWQRKMARKNQQKQALMQPELEKIQKRYGNNRQLLNQKTMELYKRENFSVMGSCLGMLINMAITLFIFFTLFSGLTGMSNTEVVNQYKTLETEYTQKFSETFEISKDDVKDKEDLIFNQAVIEAQAEMGTTDLNDKVYAKALEIMYRDENPDGSDYKKLKQVQTDVLDKYKTEKEGWLWVQNLWRPDTAASVFSDFKSYQGLAQVFKSDEFINELNKKSEGKSEEERKEIEKQLKITYENRYNMTTYAIQQNYKGSWNGYFILVILAGAVTYLSVKLSQMQSSNKNKNKQLEKANPNKAMFFMKILLPVLMIIFTVGYSAAFSLYIVTNSIMSTIISFILLKVFEKQESKKNKDGTITISPAPRNKNRPEYSREFLSEGK